ncbi:RsmD family RNA methyltransferase [Thermophagus sp. OGC60D27]|uniref:RsmD family RNA methyltransferase n=1 Tax=Thermophagus sp. OGC60D27 TaxID=3458415 RepID=UPI004037AA3C
MRIVSGQLKGRRFSPPASFKARPTTDLAREGLFNILNNLIDFDRQIVLDLFSGTGAISYEFASRGCESITAIEKNYNHFSFIKKTAQQLGLNNQIKVIKADVFKYLERNDKKYTFIFADPPYNLAELEELPPKVMNGQWLTDDGLFVLEHSPTHNFENTPFFWQSRHYGKVNFSFFRFE